MRILTKKRLLSTLPFFMSIFFLVGIQFNTVAQSSKGYKIATWKGFADAAVSYTWDDNTSSQLTVAKPIFNKYDFNATFFVVSSWDMDWDGFRLAAKEGHEIASHSVNHANLKGLSEAKRAEQLINSKNKINSEIPGEQCHTFAYPYCGVGSDEQTSQHFISARTCQGRIEKKTPQNFMRVSAISCGSRGKIKYHNEFNEKVNSAVDSSEWVVFLLHGIDTDGGYSPMESKELDAHLSYMNDNKDRFWVATYGEAVKYIKERDASSIKVIEKTDTGVILQLSNDLGSNDIYNVPLTIKKKISSKCVAPKATQNGKDIDFEVIKKKGKSYIQFNAVPNGGNIVLDIN